MRAVSVHTKGRSASGVATAARGSADSPARDDVCGMCVVTRRKCKGAFPLSVNLVQMSDETGAFVVASPVSYEMGADASMPTGEGICAAEIFFFCGTL